LINHWDWCRSQIMASHSIARDYLGRSFLLVQPIHQLSYSFHQYLFEHLGHQSNQGRFSLSNWKSHDDVFLEHVDLLRKLGRGIGQVLQEGEELYLLIQFQQSYWISLLVYFHVHLHIPPFLELPWLEL